MCSNYTKDLALFSRFQASLQFKFVVSTIISMQIPENTVYLEKYGLYVCIDGRVFREAKINAYGHKKGELYELNQTPSARGYLAVHWKGHSASVHRLKAEAFIPNPNNYPTVDHSNRDILDNRIENLKWVPWSEQESNRSNVDRCVEKYGVRTVEDMKEYKKRYNSEYHKQNQEALKKKCNDWYKKMREKGKYVHFCDGTKKVLPYEVAEELLKIPKKLRIPPT